MCKLYFWFVLKKIKTEKKKKFIAKRKMKSLQTINITIMLNPVRLNDWIRQKNQLITLEEKINSSILH